MRRQIDNNVYEQGVPDKSARQIECKNKITEQDAKCECACPVRSSGGIDSGVRKDHEFYLEQPFMPSAEDQHEVVYNKKLLEETLIDFTFPIVHRTQSEVRC